jgi:hypothetical protein
MAVVGIWTYTLETPGLDVTNIDLTGYKVEARDDEIGKVDEATYESGGSFIVVDTGPWIFGKKVMIPAGMVRDIDLDAETVFVNLTKDEIKNAPELDDNLIRDEAYRNELGGYYGSRV